MRFTESFLLSAALICGTFLAACGGGGDSSPAPASNGAAFPSQSTVVTNTVTLTDLPTGVKKLVVVPRHSTVEPKSDFAMIHFTSKVVESDKFYIKIIAYSRTQDEIQQYLSGSIREQLFDQYKVTLGDRKITCMTEYSDNRLSWIKGVCLHDVEIGIPAGSNIAVEIRDPYVR